MYNDEERKQDEMNKKIFEPNLWSHHRQFFNLVQEPDELLAM